MKKLLLEDLLKDTAQILTEISQNDEVYNVELSSEKSVVILPEHQYQVLVNALKLSHAVAFATDEDGMVDVQEAMAIMDDM